MCIEFCRWTVEKNAIITQVGATRKKVLLLGGYHMGVSWYYDGWMMVSVYTVVSKPHVLLLVYFLRLHDSEILICVCQITC